MSSWRPALRIARRSVRRNLGRSLLIAVLVGLPVAGATLIDVVARTLSAPARDAEQMMGGADATVRVTAEARLTDYRPRSRIGPQLSRTPRTGARDPASVDLAALLPPGSRVVPEPSVKHVLLDRGDRKTRVTLVLADVSDPLHRNAARLLSGRAPANPGEALVTSALAERLGVRAGDSLRVESGVSVRLTGIARAPFCLDCEMVVAAPGSQLLKDAEAGPAPGTTVPALGSVLGADEKSPAGATQLVDLPPGASADALWPKLAARGVELTPRAVYLHPERYSEGQSVDSDALRAAALVFLVAGFGLLEVVLLAGTAFAVGARRQVRELGLVSACGGSPRDVRRIVLAQGLVLGALGAIFGVIVGAAVARILGPLWQHLDNAEIHTWTFGPLEIAGAALIGLLSGLAAAAVPAIGAGRLRPADALAARFRVSRATRRRLPVAGVAMVATGVACGLLGDRLLADDFAAYERALRRVQQTGEFVTTPSAFGPVALVLAGATLLVAGIIALAPSLFGWFSRAGSNLPVAARLAVRDAARHRHRTAPATSAIAVAVAGSVVLAFVLAASFRAEKLRHVRVLPAHTLAVEPGPSAALAATRAAAQLPAAQVHALRVPVIPAEQGVKAPPDLPVSEVRGLWAGSRGLMCTEGRCVGGQGGGSALALADGAGLAVAAAGGGLDAAARRALAAGRVVIFSSTAEAGDHDVRIHAGPHEFTLPGHVARPDAVFGALPSGLIPEAVARTHGWDIAAGRQIVDYGAGATRDQVDAALNAADAAGALADVERGPKTPGNSILLIVAAAAAFVTLAGVAISVALSAAEGRADLATLAAVGAAPRRRRALAASQALLIAGVGCALGVAFGTFVAFTVRATTGSPDFVVPWTNLALTAIAVPLLAMAIAAAFTPSRLPLVRRAA